MQEKVRILKTFALVVRRRYSSFRGCFLLRQQTAIATSNLRNLLIRLYAHAVVQAGGLASLVLLRGIDSAGSLCPGSQNVRKKFRASLRWRATQANSAKTRNSVSREPLNLSEWTNQLQ